MSITPSPSRPPLVRSLPGPHCYTIGLVPTGGAELCDHDGEEAGDHGVLTEQEVAELEVLEDVGVSGKTRADPLAP